VTIQQKITKAVIEVFMRKHDVHNAAKHRCLFLFSKNT